MSTLEDAIGLSPSGQVGLVLVLLPFVLTFRVNDLIYTSMAGGAVGGLFGLYAAIQKIRGADDVGAKFIGAIAVIEVLAVYHLLDGIGML